MNLFRFGLTDELVKLSGGKASKIDEAITRLIKNLEKNKAVRAPKKSNPFNETNSGKIILPINDGRY